MTTRHLLAAMCLLSVTAARADAALYEFTLRGVVTDAVFGDVPIGAPFAIRYIADSIDLLPDPTGGLFWATPATVTFPDFSITTEGTNPGVAVFLRDGVAIQSAGYSDGVSSGPGWKLAVSCAFPPGTITTDALPLSLPLSEAIFARFHLFPIFTDQYQGNITSYESMQIPEPTIGFAASMLLLVMIKRRSRHCTSS